MKGQTELIIGIVAVVFVAALVAIQLESPTGKAIPPCPGDPPNCPNCNVGSPTITVQWDSIQNAVKITISDGQTGKLRKRELSGSWVNLNNNSLIYYDYTALAGITYEYQSFNTGTEKIPHCDELEMEWFCASFDCTRFSSIVSFDVPAGGPCEYSDCPENPPTCSPCDIGPPGISVQWNESQARVEIDVDGQLRRLSRRDVEIGTWYPQDNTTNPWYDYVPDNVEIGATYDYRTDQWGSGEYPTCTGNTPNCIWECIPNNCVEYSETITIVLTDTTPPTVNIIDPTSSDVSGLVHIEAEASDLSGIKNIKFYINNTDEVIENYSPYEFTWDSTSIGNGEHTIKALAEDNSGNTAFDEMTVIVTNPDTTPPEINITFPSSGSTVNGTITITANATDDTAVDKVEFYVNGALKETDYIGSSDEYEFEWNTNDLDGPYQIKAKAVDAAGNYAEDEITLTVNNEAPSVIISFPVNGAIIHDTIQISAIATDPNSPIATLNLLVDDVIIKPCTSSTCNYSWDTTSVSDTTHTIKAIAENLEGIIGESQEITVLVDNADPTVNITSPSNGATVGGPSVTIRATATDNSGGSGLEEIKLYIQGSYITNCDAPPSPCTFSWNTESIPSGTRSIKAEAIDKAGNKKEKVISVFVDNTEDPQAPATPGGLGTQPGNNSGEIKVSWSLSDGATSYQMVWWYAEGVENPVTGNPPRIYKTDSSPLIGLNHCHKVRACNSIGCSSYTSNVCTYPQIGVDHGGEYSGGKETNIELDASVEYPVNPSFSWDFSGSILSSCTINGNTTATPTVNCSEEGTLDATLTVVDEGKTLIEETTIQITLTQDTTDPTISITEPADGNTVLGTVVIKAQASDDDSGIKKVEFYIDNSLEDFDDQEPYEISWNSAEVENGSHTIEAIAIDLAGNTTEESIEITVDNPLVPECGNDVIETIIGEECELDLDCEALYSSFYCDYDLKKYGSRDVECESCACIAEDWSYSTTKYCNECEHCGDGEINCSETIENCPEDTSAPARPTGLELIRTTKDTAVILWNPNTEENLKRYIVYYGTSSRNYPDKEYADKTEMNITLTDLEYGTKYYIAIKAENEKGRTSDYSNEIIAETKQGPPIPAPTNLTAKQKSDYAFLEWDHTSPRPDDYVIEREEGEGWEELKTTSRNNYSDKSVKTGETYTYRVKAVEDGKSSDYSNEDEVKIKEAEIPEEDDSIFWIIGATIIVIAGALAYAYYHFEG